MGDGGRVSSHGRGQNGHVGAAQDPDLGGVAIDVPKGPKPKRSVDVHEDGGGGSVAGELDGAVGSDCKAELVANVGRIGHVLADHPKFSPIKEQIFIKKEKK